MEMSRRAPAIVAAATRTGGLRSRPTNSRDPRFNLKQFVGEDAQAIDRGGFDPQYDRAECDRDLLPGHHPCSAAEIALCWVHPAVPMTGAPLTRPLGELMIRMLLSVRAWLGAQPAQ